VAIAAIFGFGLGVEIFFLFIPAWGAALILYPVIASVSGAKAVDTARLEEGEASDARRRAAEQEFLRNPPAIKSAGKGNGLLLGGAAVSLLVAAGMGVWVLTTGELVSFQSMLIWPSLAYFIFAIILVMRENAKGDA